ncbi:NAD(P)/FAD-dependent oxidoreductase [Mycobacteroides abscessus]|uniref:NAD(P)/FAD-dependent oxidoreductase n=1 Tax=Mycobacteroides abscessus TaxID=36809 RepID=UPI003AF47B57
MSDTRHLVVVGASLAGLRAVEGARKAGFTGKISLIGSESHVPYNRPPLSKEFLSPVAAAGIPEFRSRSELEQLDIDLQLGCPAIGLDPQAHDVVLGDGSTTSYDALVIATGASARKWPGTPELTGVHTVRTVDDARAVRAALDARARTVVIGAGFVGSEVASAARSRGLDVTMIEAQTVPISRSVGSVMGDAFAVMHRQNGTDLRCGATVAAIEGSGAVEQVRLATGETIRADLVVVGIGTEPSIGWLEQSGIALNDGVRCDATLRTSVPDVYAAGDVARWDNPEFGRPMRLEHWVSAAEQGVFAARNALNPTDAMPYSTVPYFWSDWYGARIQFVGIPDDRMLRVFGAVSEGQLLALYGDGTRLVGALAINRQPDIMKLRALIAQSGSWTDALQLVVERVRGWRVRHP